jgi:hypothetical protein
MKFAPAAIVYHTHPETLWRYLKRKYKFAFWRVLAVRKNPSKAVKDSHTPQLMKLQLVFPPALPLVVAFDLMARSALHASLFMVAISLATTLPFAVRTIAKDPVVGLLSPVLIAARAWAQVIGVTAGLICTRRKTAPVPTKSPT